MTDEQLFALERDARRLVVAVERLRLAHARRAYEPHRGAHLSPRRLEEHVHDACEALAQVLPTARPPAVATDEPVGFQLAELLDERCSIPRPPVPPMFYADSLGNQRVRYGCGHLREVNDAELMMHSSATLANMLRVCPVHDTLEC